MFTEPRISYLALCDTCKQPLGMHSENGYTNLGRCVAMSYKGRAVAWNVKTGWYLVTYKTPSLAVLLNLIKMLCTK